MENQIKFIRTAEIVKKAGIIWFILFACAFQIVKAQGNYENTGPDLDPIIGIKAGASFSNFMYSDDQVTDKHLLTMPFGGIFIKAPITRFFAISPELNYVVRGSKVDYTFGAGILTPGNGSVSFKLHYLELPILAVINLSPYFNIHAGPYVAYLLRANLSNQSQNTSFNSYRDLNTSDFQKFDYGLAGGIGFDLKPLTIGARYNYGLRSINNSTISNVIANNAKNSTFTVYVGLGF